MRRLLNFYQLPAERKALICSVVFWLIWFRCCLWILPFGIAKKWLPYENPKGITEIQVDRSLILSIASLVKRLSRYVPRATCLTQALTTKKILRDVGQASVLKLGVKFNKEGKFQAHAWIEINDRIVVGRQPNHYRFAVLNSSDTIIV